MKKLVRYPQQISERWEIEWDIEIYPKDEFIKGATSILDTGSQEYQNFISSLIVEFENAGFELYNDKRYTHPSNTEGSQSDYYTFLQIKDYILIEVIVHVRISDHPMPDKQSGTSAERRARYLGRTAKELAEEYQLDSYPYAIPVDIIFRDEDDSKSKYLKSYVAAMFKIRHEIGEIVEQIEEWKSSNS